MPTNVTREYSNAELKYMNARTIEEKMEATKEMLSTVPKHKGTEVLRMELRDRLKRFKEQQMKEKKRKKGGHSIAVAKEGFQVVIVGYPNAGKSTLLNKLTNVDTPVADYPFTTKEPVVGMMNYEGGMLQIVEVPALMEGAAETQGELMSIIHSSDAIILLYENEQQKRALMGEFIKFHIEKPVMFVQKGQPVTPQSIFNHFQLIRVYTKQPGGAPVQEKPILLKRGATILDAAKEIHKDFVKNLKYARVWGSSKFHGQRVEKDYILKDKDVVEFHV